MKKYSQMLLYLLVIIWHHFATIIGNLLILIASQKLYIQQEVNSLNRIDDSYTKMVIVKDDILPWTDERGIQYINIEDFLLKTINEM